MTRHGSGNAQNYLDFRGADAAYYERRNTLGRALRLVPVDCSVFVFVRLLFDFEEQYPGSALVASYAELMRMPWGFSCSLSKTRSAIERASELGLVVVTAQHARGQKANAYRINWPIISSILGTPAQDFTATPTESPDRHEAVETHLTSAKEAGHLSAIPSAPPAFLQHPHAFIEHTPVAKRHGVFPKKHPSEDILNNITYNQHHGLVLENNSSCVPYDDDVVKEKLPWDEILKRFAHLRRSLYPANYRLVQNQSELLLCCAIMSERFGADWLEHGLQATKRNARDKCGYLRRTLTNALCEYVGLCRAEDAPAVFADAWKAARPRARAYIRTQAKEDQVPELPAPSESPVPPSPSNVTKASMAPSVLAAFNRTLGKRFPEAT